VSDAPDYTMETVLVTGAAGFLGGRICWELLSRGSRVIAVDNYSTGSQTTLIALRYSKFSDRIQVIEHDITDPGLDRLVPRCDKIINLACPASPVQYRLNPLGTLAASSVGVMNLLDLALINRATFLQASTSEVYGDPLRCPQVETDPGYVDSMCDRACYVEGKRSAEVAVTLYRERCGVSTRIARIFNSYGPGMSPDDGRVVSTFIRQALDEEPLSVHGNGEQTRSLCFISDTVRGLLSMADYPCAITHPINVGNPDEVKIIDLAAEIWQMIHPGTVPEIDYLPASEQDPRRRLPDIRRANEVLGWDPVISRDEGLRWTIDWFRGRLQGPGATVDTP